MSVRFSFRRDVKGIGEILKSEAVQKVVADIAEQVAKNVEGQHIEVGAFKGGQGPIEIPVTTSARVTDRAHGSVTLAHPAGLAVQAKHGALTKAAAEAGLEVKERKR